MIRRGTGQRGTGFTARGAGRRKSNGIGLNPPSKPRLPGARGCPRASRMLESRLAALAVELCARETEGAFKRFL